MDKDHRLDAPNNDSLQDIEQIANHSDLSSLYFNAHKEWEGKELISDEERQSRRDKEQFEISRSIRKWFVVIGILTPLSLILFVILITSAVTYFNPDNLRSFLPVAIGATAVWMLVSYLATRRLYAIFYQHALSATPFSVVLFALLGLSAQEIFLLTRHFHTDSLLGNTLIVASGTLLASIALSGALLEIWTSPRLSANGKLSWIIGLVVALLLLIMIAAFL